MHGFILHILSALYMRCVPMISGKSQLKKTVIVATFCIFSFVSMAACDLHALQAALSLPLERLGDVRCHAISRTPISVLIGGLLSENEGGQLSLRPRPPLKQ